MNLLSFIIVVFACSLPLFVDAEKYTGRDIDLQNHDRGSAKDVRRKLKPLEEPRKVKKKRKGTAEKKNPAEEGLAQKEAELEVELKEAEEKLAEEEEELEEEFSEVDINTGCMLIGGVSFVFVLFSLVSWEDDDIRRYAWALVSMVGAIFVGVMIFEAVNRWVLTYAQGFSHPRLCLLQYAHLFAWTCCLQLTLALASGSILEGEHSLDLEQWVINDAVRADHGTPVRNTAGEYDESLVRNRTGTKSVSKLKGIEVPVEKKKSNLEQRRRRMTCWGTLLAHMCGFAAINAGGTLQHLHIFSASPAMSLGPLVINQIFIHIVFGLFKAMRLCVEAKARAEGRAGVRSALYDEFASSAENDIICLGSSYLLVASVRFYQAGALPTMTGHLDDTPWHCISALYSTGLVFICIAVLLIQFKVRLDLLEGACLAKTLNLLVGMLGFGSSWCWLFASREVFTASTWLHAYGIGMHTILGRVVLSLGMSLISACFIFGLDKISDLAKRASPPGKNPEKESVALLVFSMSILVGFSWEHAFEGSVESIANSTKNPLYTQSGLAIFMFVVVVPSWRRHILKRSLILEKYHELQEQADLDIANTASSTPFVDGCSTTDRNMSPNNIWSEAGKVYSALPTEPPEDRAAGGPAGIPEANGQTGPTMWPKEVSACLGMAKAITILGGVEKNQPCAVEKTSVYGAAIAIPQIARSAKWPKSMCGLAFRSYMFVLLNYCVQTLFVYYIYDSQTNMNPFGGQMHLCDFASHISSCPEGPDCTGPGGAPIPDPGALYPFDIWYTRGFLRDSLQALFPDRAEEIGAKVDPGEYGLESYYCRLLCIFVFVLQIGDEFQGIRDLIRFLRKVPEAEADEAPWVQYTSPDGEKTKDAHGDGELEYVTFSVNAMPLRWKVFNVVFLLIPRIFIWRMVTMCGVRFLMETAAMVDQIVNTTALSFVLTTDELVLERLATQATKHMMAKLENIELFDYSPYENETDQQALERYDEREMRWSSESNFSVIPRRLFWTLLLMSLFTAEYYLLNCKKTESGGWVSKDLYLPEHAHLSFVNFIKDFFSLGDQKAPSKDAVWSMPVPH